MKKFSILAFGLILLSNSLWSCKGGGAAEEYLMSTDTTLSLVVREWSKRIEKYPENHEYLIGRSDELSKNSKFDLALKDIEKAIELKSDIPSYYAKKGDVLMAMNETFQASKTYEEAYSKFPKDLESAINMGRFYMIVRKYEESEKALNRALELNKLSPEAWFYTGIVSKEQGDTTKAIASFDQCLIIDNEHIDACIQIGQLYTALKDAKGLDYFSKAISIDEFSDEAYYGRALLKQELGRLEEAIEDYQKTIDINARHYLAYYNTGYILFGQKNWDRAIEHFRIAVKFAPDYIKGHYMLGLCNEGKENNEQAFVHYTKCLEIDPDYSPAKNGLQRLQ